VAAALFSMGYFELDAFAASVLRQELYTVGLKCITDRSHGVLVRLAYLAFKVANCPDADASLLFQLGLGPLKECPCGAALRGEIRIVSSVRCRIAMSVTRGRPRL
jgi:hypothetical protein